MKRLYLICIPRWQAIAVLAVMALTCLSLASAITMEVLSQRLSSISRSIRGKTVIIDPGHGGIDGGANYGSGADRIVEKNVTLQFAFVLADILTECGARPILTRYEDVLYGETPREELEKRLEIMREFAADVFVSIHLNAFPDPSCFGAQVFYFPGSEQDRQLAMLIQEELLRIDPENFREAASADFFVLRKTKVPAVLVELGFVSNARDRQLMTDPVFQAKMAEAIIAGIARYFAGERIRPARPSSEMPRPAMIRTSTRTTGTSRILQ